MTTWAIAALVGIAAALLSYARQRSIAPAVRLLLALLRAVALVLATALLLDAPLGRARPERPWVFVDASQSMTRGGNALWRAALDSVRRSAADSVFTFGDSIAPRSPDDTSGASQAATMLRPVVDRVTSAGRPAIVLTDGELPDADLRGDLANGSRVVVLSRGAVVDAAVTSIDAPRATVAGDTIEVRLTVAAGAVATAAGRLVLRLDDRDVASAALAPMSPWSEREMSLRVPVAGAEGIRILRAMVFVPADAEPRNDTLATTLEVSRAASAVFVSTSPDQDSRFVLAVLRGVLALPTRGFLRVAPGTWREEGTLSATTESDVRRAVRDAPVVVLHGDTAIFGAPESVTRAPVALLVPADTTSGEWYPSATPPSPLSPAFASLPLDSLPPIVAGAAAAGDWTALEMRRGRSGSRRAVITGRDAPRRRVTITGSGFWRWRFRGGISADAYATLWGSLFDWLAQERADRRVVLPQSPLLRAGERVRWQRGAGADTLVRVRLRRRGRDSVVTTYDLHFGADAAVRETPAPPPGIYDADVPGGRVTLAVNPSAELLPARPRLASGAVGRHASGLLPPGARSAAWLYALVVLLLCAEWIGRRRVGLR